jgi:FdrA protein
MKNTSSDIRRGAYYDSVVLMQLQRALADLPGVLDAGVVMGTPANKALLADSGLLTPEAENAGPEDLLIVVEAEDVQRAEETLEEVDSLLEQRRSRAGQGAYRPRSLAAGVKALPQAAWVLISVPGRYAAGVAREALEAEKHVFLYSDNVPVEDEVGLKQTAREKGLLVMGPDCGTAIVNGVGLGFANYVRGGSVGLVAASGTGLQAITSHVHRLGGGISQAIGTGGRDLSSEVGGITSLQGLDVLGRDPATKVIVLLSKPPADEVVARLLAKARSLDKPVVVYFMGRPVINRRLGNLSFAQNLRETAELAVAAGEENPATAEAERRVSTLHPSLSGGGRRYLRGLFSGGTLAYEMLLGLQNSLSPLYSNVPLRRSQRLSDPLQSQAHTILDLGEDTFTQGRLHPMMDNTLRIRRLREEAAQADVGLILLDVVLGEGAHPDPAGDLAPAIEEVVAAQEIPVAVLLVGTEEDPQDLAAQAQTLETAGATLFYDTTEVISAVSAALATSDVSGGAAVSLHDLERPLAAVNVGLESFYDSLKGQGAEVVHVAWRPPAGGDEKMMALLARLKHS